MNIANLVIAYAPIKLMPNFLALYHIILKISNFVLKYNNKELETVTKTISNTKHPLLCTTYEPNIIKVNFNKKAITKKELENYIVEIYLYKDEKFKTLAAELDLSNILK